MVDIVHSGVRVNKLDEILDNLYDVVLCEDANLRIGVETELLVDTVTSNLAEVVTLVREEEVLEHFTC